MVPLSVLFSGLVTQFVPGRVGLVLNLVALFVNGLGVDFVLTPSTAYIVDILHQRSAEATAASMCVAARRPYVRVLTGCAGVSAGSSSRSSWPSSCPR